MAIAQKGIFIEGTTGFNYLGYSIPPTQRNFFFWINSDQPDKYFKVAQSIQNEITQNQ